MPRPHRPRKGHAESVEVPDPFRLTPSTSTVGKSLNRPRISIHFHRLSPSSFTSSLAVIIPRKKVRSNPSVRQLFRQMIVRLPRRPVHRRPVPVQRRRKRTVPAARRQQILRSIIIPLNQLVPDLHIRSLPEPPPPTSSLTASAPPPHSPPPAQTAAPPSSHPPDSPSPSPTHSPSPPSPPASTDRAPIPTRSTNAPSPHKPTSHFSLLTSHFPAPAPAATRSSASPPAAARPPAASPAPSTSSPATPSHTGSR
jgi:hypothetical protein